MTPPERLRVAGAALNQTPLDWPGNQARIVQALQSARQRQVQVLLLPELAISGYGCEDAFHGEWVAHKAMESLLALLPHTQGLVAAVGLPLLHQERLFNAVALLVDGRLVGFAAKRVLAGAGVYYEPRWFSPWPVGHMVSHTVAGQTLPLGDVWFEVGGVRLGFEICEEAWGRDLALAGHSAPTAALNAAQVPGVTWLDAALAEGSLDVVLNPSASHFAFGKYQTLRGIVQEGSRQLHGVYLFANLLGNESGRLIFDGAVLAAADGHLLAEGPRFSFAEVALTDRVVDLRSLRLERRRLAYPLAQGQRPRALVRVDHTFAPCSGSATVAEAAPLAERSVEFAHALALGLFDYLRKSHAQGYAVSLSGGVDSSTVAVLIHLMLRFALNQLGGDELARRLGHRPNPQPRQHQDDLALWMGQMCRTVYQASANSSELTRQAAKELAQALGARHMEWDIEPLVAGYEALAQQALGRPLSWATDDTARQNIQARVRSPGIWLLANLEGLLLVSTSNRSEAGVGYCTMDGDTSGGLAPLAGINKTFLREWLVTLEHQGLPAAHGHPAVAPLPQLAAVNRQAPTAELRPEAQVQTDEGDLMPYVVLDAIEQAAIRDRMSPVQVWQKLVAQPPTADAASPARMAQWVERFFMLWAASQWKRERLAPAFHLDDENLDPKTWCRFPILSGGYASELAELKIALTQTQNPRGIVKEPMNLIDRFRGVFTSRQTQELAPEEIDQRVAVTVVLLSTAEADQDFSPVEWDTIMKELKTYYHLSEGQVKELMDLAFQSRALVSDLWPFTTTISRKFTPEQKLAVLIMVWKVVFADGKLDPQEDRLMHRLQHMISINHSVLMEAKRLAKAQI